MMIYTNKLTHLLIYLKKKEKKKHNTLDSYLDFFLILLF